MGPISSPLSGSIVSNVIVRANVKRKLNRYLPMIYLEAGVDINNILWNMFMYSTKLPLVQMYLCT